MCAKSLKIYISLAALFSALVLFSNSVAKAANMTVTNLFPANGAVGVCADTKLWITFDTVPIVTTTGTLQICRASDNAIMYQLVLQVLPTDQYGPINGANLWPYKINLNGLYINYVPFAVSSKTLEIWPSIHLDYNTEYYVRITPGFCTDSGGNTSPDMNNTTSWRFTTKTSAPPADRDYVVALDGTGDYCTIQGAVDSEANNDPCRSLIRIKNGSYREVINIPTAKINMTWLGQDSNATIIAGYNRELFNTGTASRVMVKNYGNYFRMYNLTFHNTAPDNSGQAETIRNNAYECLAKNCKYKSYQDTVLVNAGTAYFGNCYIEGDTDYIWGGGTGYFDKCEMRSLTSSTSYITQPRAAQDVNGIFLVDCNLTTPPGVIGIYLGRTANKNFPYAQSVYLNCIMSSSVVYGVGWKFSSEDTDFNNYRFWEYKSVDRSGNLINVLNRIKPGSRQLTDDEAVMLRDVNYIYKPAWNPKSLPDLPTFSWEPSPADGAIGVPAEGTTLTWAAGAEATKHMIYFGTANPPDFATEQNDTSFATEVMLPNTTYYWRIDEKNSNGVTAGTVWSFTTNRYLCTGPIVSDLNDDCEVDFLDYAQLADVWAGNLMDIAQFAVDWLICNRNPANECWQ